jgi:cytochrome bd-type quinol oxidase subunit 1
MSDRGGQLLRCGPAVHVGQFGHRIAQLNLREVPSLMLEHGRQPWVIEGVLSTALGVSSTDAGNVLFSIISFALFYSALLVIDLSLLVKYIRCGPDEVLARSLRMVRAAAE